MVKVQQRGLGKGLSALISDNYVATALTESAPSSPSSELEIMALMPGKFQPRTHFNEEHLHELAASIEKNGIMQPIVVRASQVLPGKYEIIAGERRWRAAQMAGLSRVPVIVRDISDVQALELALIENIQRQDLTPLEEALGYQRLLEEFNYTQETLAETVGKSRSHVSNLLRLLTLPPEIKEMLEKGDLSMGHARALLTAQDPITLARTAVSRGLNVRQVETLAREEQGQPRQQRPRGGAEGRMSASRPAAPTAPKDADILALEESLSDNLGMRVCINDRGQQGEMTIAYESLAQLDDILRRLGGGF